MPAVGRSGLSVQLREHEQQDANDRMKGERSMSLIYTRVHEYLNSEEEGGASK